MLQELEQILVQQVNQELLALVVVQEIKVLLDLEQILVQQVNQELRALVV